MSVRWCFLGSHEIPEGDRTVMAQGGAHICLPCSETPRGQCLITPFETTAGYYPSQDVGPRWARRRRAWLKKLHTS